MWESAWTICRTNGQHGKRRQLRRQVRGQMVVVLQLIRDQFWKCECAEETRLFNEGRSPVWLCVVIVNGFLGHFRFIAVFALDINYTPNDSFYFFERADSIQKVLTAEDINEVLFLTSCTTSPRGIFFLRDGGGMIDRRHEDSIENVLVCCFFGL